MGVVVSRVAVGRLCLGALSFDPRGRPRLDLGATLVAGRSSMVILAGVFAASTWDFVICDASGNLSIIWWRCSIL